MWQHGCGDVDVGLWEAVRAGSQNDVGLCLARLWFARLSFLLLTGVARSG